MSLQKHLIPTPLEMRISFEVPHYTYMQVDFACSFVRVCCELTICSLRKINFCFNL